MTWRGDVDRLRRAGREPGAALDGDGHLPPLKRLVLVTSRVGARARPVGGRRAAQGRAAFSRRISRAACGWRSAISARRTSSSARSSAAAKASSPRSSSPSSSCLRDRVPAEPFDAVRRVVELELGRSLDDVFTSFERTPIAAASIAQVHAATLRTGEERRRQGAAPADRASRTRRHRSDGVARAASRRPHPGRRAREPARVDRAVRGDDRRGARLPARSARTCSTSRACSPRPTSGRRSFRARTRRS